MFRSQRDEDNWHQAWQSVAGLQPPPPPLPAVRRRQPTAGGAGPSRPTEEQLLQAVLDDNERPLPFDGQLLGTPQDRAIQALRGGRQLEQHERPTVYTAAGKRMELLEKKLEALDMKVAELYTSHHSAQIDMLHVQARVLSQVIWGATGTALVEVEDGKNSRTPSAWEEVRVIVGATNIKYAKDAAAEIIGGSVCWRMCELHRPTLMAEFSSGAFTLETFLRLARKVISLHLAFSQASGLTPQAARITMKNAGVFDWYGIVDEAISGSAERRERNRDRGQRMRLAARQAQWAQADRDALLRRLGLAAEELLPIDPSERPEAMEAELAAMLTDEERAAATAPLLAPAPPALPPVAAAVTAATAAAPEIVATPPAVRTRAAAERANAAMAAAAAATRADQGTVRRSKRVASASRRNGGGGGGDGGGGGGGGDGRGSSTPRAMRRARLAEPEREGDEAQAEGDEVEDNGGDTEEVAEEEEEEEEAIEGEEVVAEVDPDAPAPPAAAAGNGATTEEEDEDMDPPVYAANKPPSSDVVIKYLSALPADMVSFVLPLLREADRVGLPNAAALDAAGVSAGDSDDDDGGAFPLADGRFFCEIAAAFEEASALVHDLDPHGARALAFNRSVIRGDMRIFSLGLGSSFTTFSMFEHTTTRAPDGAAAGAARAALLEDWTARIFGDRYDGTTMITVFVDPDSQGGGDGNEADGSGDSDGDSDGDGDGGLRGGGGRGAGGEGNPPPLPPPHAFRLVFADGTRLRLSHGMVLISRPGGQTWKVERVERRLKRVAAGAGAASSNGNGDVNGNVDGSSNGAAPRTEERKLREVRFLASRGCLDTVCSNGPRFGREVAGLRDPPSLARSFVDAMSAMGKLTRRQALAMFANVVA